MAKTAHTTTAPAPAQPGFIDPTTLPDEYAMRVRGDCLAPAIKAGDAVLFDQRQPVAPGDLVGVYLKPGCFGGSTSVGLKRLVINMMPGVTYPYKAHPDSNIMPVIVCEQDNPHRQYTIPAGQILAIHRCLGLVPAGVALYDEPAGEPEYRQAVSAGWSRRDLLAGVVTILPAGALASLPAVAVEVPDPIFAAIEAHKAADKRFAAAVAQEFRLEDELPQEVRQSWTAVWGESNIETDDPRWIEAIKARDEASDTADQLAWGLVETPPTTVAGAAALLAYMAKVNEGCMPDNDFHQAVHQMLAKALARTAGGAS